MFTNRYFVQIIPIILVLNSSRYTTGRNFNATTRPKLLETTKNVDRILPLEMDYIDSEKIKNIQRYFEQDFKQEDFENFKPDTTERNTILATKKTASSSNPNIPKKVKRGVANIKRYIEALVVLDQSFLSYHKETDVEKYLLAIFSTANLYLKDPSLQQDIELNVVRIIFLKNNHNETNLKITNNIQTTLDSFAQWSDKVNYPENHPQHHDVGILLSREDFCDEGNCAVAGLSHVGGGCVANMSALIIEDVGLTKTSNYIVHEIGHLLGCDHDGIKSSALCTDGMNLMFPSTYSFRPVSRWSKCSAKSVEIFLDAGLGDCLNNKPTSVKNLSHNILPGALFDRNQQCQVLHYDHFCEALEEWEEDSCSELICQNMDEGCLIITDQVADGTSCGADKWCINQECVNKQQSSIPVSGGWSNWSSWSECSRTCGGGVSTKFRVCNNPEPKNGGEFCKGDRKMARICSTQVCNVSSLPKTFRQIQCDIKWQALNKSGISTAGISNEDPCGLYCKAEGSFEFTQLERFVKDGTDCRTDQYFENWKCIWGHCTKIGCNNQMDSNATLDQCGHCMGDGTNCTIITDTFRKINLLEGPLKVVEFPKLSSMILIEELGNSMNAIVITGRNWNNVYLNSNLSLGVEDPPGTKFFGNVEAEYTIVYPFQEKLFIQGPLDEELVFYVFFFDPLNVGYRYRYAVPKY